MKEQSSFSDIPTQTHIYHPDGSVEVVTGYPYDTIDRGTPGRVRCLVADRVVLELLSPSQALQPKRAPQRPQSPSSIFDTLLKNLGVWKAVKFLLWSGVFKVFLTDETLDYSGVNSGVQKIVERAKNHKKQIWDFTVRLTLSSEDKDILLRAIKYGLIDDMQISEIIYAYCILHSTEKYKEILITPQQRRKFFISLIEQK